MTVPTWPRQATARNREPGLAATLVLYAAARLGILAVVTALMMLAGVPFVLAVLIALIVALPLSMVLFRGLRARLDAALAERGARRRTERDELRAELRGDRPAATVSEAEGSTDGQPGGGGDRPGQQ